MVEPFVPSSWIFLNSSSILSSSTDFMTAKLSWSEPTVFANVCSRLFVVLYGIQFKISRASHKRKTLRPSVAILPAVLAHSTIVQVCHLLHLSASFTACLLLLLSKTLMDINGRSKHVVPECSYKCSWELQACNITLQCVYYIRWL